MRSTEYLGRPAAEHVFFRLGLTFSVCEDTNGGRGQQEACRSCKGKMNNLATESNPIIYQWRENGQTQTWIATPKLSN